MCRKILPALAVLLLVPGSVFAQTATIQGAVVDNRTEDPLSGVHVVIQELQREAATDAQGQFKVPVDSGSFTLRASLVGYRDFETKVHVDTGETVREDLRLKHAELGLDEVVLTGVAEGRKRANLGFSVDRVGENTLHQVPRTDPANALRGKIAGAQIIQPSGDPAANASIRLRGSTSITGDQQPLIILDGIITDGGVNDISMQDVESIEVVKGAAASSLYGSLAGNGIVRITTKTGSESSDLEVRVRSEYGQSEIVEKYPKATRHPWQLDSLVARRPDGSTVTLINPSEEELRRQIPTGSKMIAWKGRSEEIVADDGLFDNPFPVLYDNSEKVFTGKPYSTNYVALSDRGNEYSFLASYERLHQGGTVEPMDPYERNTVRLNADYTPDSRLSASFTSSYVTVSSPNIQGPRLGDNYFYSVLTADPYVDMTETTEDGAYSNNPTGYDIQSSNWQNPLYVARTREQTFDRRRILAGVKVDFRLADNLFLHVRESFDQQFTNHTTFYPVGYETPHVDPTVSEGFERRQSSQNRATVTEAWASVERDVGDFTWSATAKYLYEDREFSRHAGSGSRYDAAGIRNLGALDASTYSISSRQTEERTDNYVFTMSVNYDDIVIADGLIRQDGSSLFGVEERWQTYYRGSVAYRLSEQFEIPDVQQLKVRASYGVSGNRPPFQARYETFDVDSGEISPQVLGNEHLRPSESSEVELGVDVGFLNRVRLTANYAKSVVEDDYLLVPLSSAAGFSSQWQNVATLESTSYEVSLQGQILRRQGLNWTANMTWSTTAQTYKELDGMAPFYRTTSAELDVFRVEEGLPYGNLYGNKVLTSLDQLTIVDGTVLNSGGDSVEDFTVNEYGYVVPAGTKGTPNEQVVYAVDENGNKTTEQIGNTSPDFTVGLYSTLSWKGVGVYALVDWSKGGDVYNYTKQLLYFNDRHKDLQEFAADGHHWGYANSSSTIYNLSTASSYFVEDASYVKLREVALSYTLGQDQLNVVFGQSIDRIQLSVTGRNLLTFTGYSGWDPEVALRSNSTNFRLDEFAYPNYRTYTGAIELTF